MPVDHRHQQDGQRSGVPGRWARMPSIPRTPSSDLAACGTWPCRSVRGRLEFKDFEAHDPDRRGSELDFEGASLTIDANSVDTRDENRDNHLRSDDFFDVANHPTWTFASTA